MASSVNVIGPTGPSGPPPGAPPPSRSPAPTPPSPPTFQVDTVTGHVLEVLSQDEVTYYNTAKDRYLADNAFTVASDLRSLDRLILCELLIYRWQRYLASGKGPDGSILANSEEYAYRKSIKETAPQVSEIQADLGLTFSAREREKFESVGKYIENLKIAAKEHGIRREKQLGKSLELLQELFAIVGAFDRANKRERQKLGFESESDIIEWIRQARPQYDAIDDHFRQHQQKFWIRTI